MRFFRKYATLLIVSFLIVAFAPSNAYSETVIIKDIELLRRGKQIGVKLVTSIKPDYQITENLALQHHYA